MKNRIFSVLIFVGLAIFSRSFAKTDSLILLAQAEAVTISDLGIEDVGLLPTNPFYFFKEWTRSFRRTVTTDPILKAGLELQIVNEKAAELRRVDELSGQNPVPVEKAIRNYRDSQERLKNRLSELENVAQNPNVEKLLSELADRAVKHEKLFDILADKFSDRQEVKNLTDSAKGLLEQAVAAVSSKDDPKEFADKFKKALESSKGGAFKNAYSAEIIGRIKEVVADDVKKELDAVQRDFSKKSDSDIQGLLREKSVPELESFLDELPPSEIRAEIGEKIFEKQREELNSGSLMPVSVPLPMHEEIRAEIAVCDQIGRNLDEVWDLYKSGRITEQEYTQKYEVLKKQLATCGAASSSVPMENTYPVESGGAVVCTQQYDPVCGVNGKTYSNDCVAKGSGILIQYRGECKLSESNSSIPSDTENILDVETKSY